MDQLASLVPVQVVLVALLLREARPLARTAAILLLHKRFPKASAEELARALTMGRQRRQRQR